MPYIDFIPATKANTNRKEDMPDFIPEIQLTDTIKNPSVIKSSKKEVKKEPQNGNKPNTKRNRESQSN